MRLFPSTALVAILAAGLPAAAQTSCSGANVSLLFGVYDVLNASPTDSQADYLVTCTRNGGSSSTQLTISIGPSGTSGTVANRQMLRSGGTERMDYNIFRDFAGGSVWGQTVGTDTVTRTISVPNNGTNTISVRLFGRIRPGQDLRVGSYGDSLTITVIP